MSKRVFQAIQNGDKGSLLSVLDDEPLAARAVDEKGISALMTALYYHQFELAEILAQRNPELSFLEACALGRVDEARRMLEHAPELVAGRSPDGFTALHLASFFGRTGVVRLLIEEGAPVNVPADNPSRVSPLHSAVASRNLEVVETLVEAGADLEARQQGGYTPLMGASANGRRRMVEFLLAHGANPEACSDEGQTARDLALAKGFTDVY
jgi:ankyrin repeat protein